MKTHVCLVSYHELGLKGKNRSTFERRLVDNLSFLLGERFTVRKIHGRILVDVAKAEEIDEVAYRISRVPGVANVMPSLCVGRDLSEMCHVSLRAIEKITPAPLTFRVTAKRSNTDFEMTSQELNEQIGAFLVEHTEMHVDLKNPDVNVRVTVIGGKTFISVIKISGAGGLPVGSSGKLISLLSSGFDSPVATWRMIRRGAIGIGLHFSAAPAVSDTSTRQVHEIGEILAETGGLARIYSVPFGDIQREIASTIYPDLRILLYRRVMFAVAQRLAQAENAKALLTGESLGQVASQTMENLIATSEGVTIPIFRPLIGDDKHEIIEIAKRIGTYDLSAQAVDDCCTLFMPRSPETHVKLARIHEACAQLDIERFVDECLEVMDWQDYPCNRYTAPKTLIK
ncbi:MAG: tRNA 4-thiouridine(8) synthase ThiI [Coriobacteriia bacterium]|nr:tRNA 4-thiouridine(8) synthase ThiI [Coriobacteriia bacterium]